MTLAHGTDANARETNNIAVFEKQVVNRRTVDNWCATGLPSQADFNDTQ